MPSVCLHSYLGLQNEKMVNLLIQCVTALLRTRQDWNKYIFWSCEEQARKSCQDHIRHILDNWNMSSALTAETMIPCKGKARQSKIYIAHFIPRANPLWLGVWNVHRKSTKNKNKTSKSTKIKNKQTKTQRIKTRKHTSKYILKRKINQIVEADQITWTIVKGKASLFI